MKVRPVVYFLNGLIIFALLGSEFPLLFVTRIADCRPASQVFSWPINWYGAVAHWTVTIAVWATGVFLFALWAKRRGVISDLVHFELDRKGKMVLIAGAASAALYSLTWSTVAGQTIPQVYREYLGFQSMYGSNALIVTVFQNIYYAVEFLLVFAMIAFFQKAGEMWSKAEHVPWGSLGLMLTWGAVHFATNPAGALGVMLWSLIPGVIYVVGDKGFAPVYLALVLGFLI